MMEFSVLNRKCGRRRDSSDDRRACAVSYCALYFRLSYIAMPTKQSTPMNVAGTTTDLTMLEYNFHGKACKVARTANPMMIPTFKMIAAPAMRIVHRET